MKALPASSNFCALHLHVAGEQTRLGIDPAFRLQRHDFLGDFLRVIRFVRADLGFAEREERLGFRRRVGRASREISRATASASSGWFSFISASPR